MRSKEAVLKCSQALYDTGDQWFVFLQCGQHDPRSLPTTSDTKDRYCENCCVLWSSSGKALNAPRAPMVLVRVRWPGDRQASRERVDHIPSQGETIRFLSTVDQRLHSARTVLDADDPDGLKVLEVVSSNQ